MKTSNNLLAISGLLVAVALATPGCATKKYVRNQTAPINQRITDIDQKQTQAIAALDGKEQKDVSRVEERAMTAENKANDAAKAAQVADAKAVQAGQTANNAVQMAQANQGKIGDLSNAVQNIDNFKLVSTEDILFGFNKSQLTPEAKDKLASIAQQTAGMNRYVLEVEGFTDKTGPADYNLALSRRRADAVVRYLVDQNIPLRRIHMIGLGVASSQPMTDMQNTATQRGTARMKAKEMRRVVVKVWAPEGAATATAQTQTRQ
jgi:OOP family OmpA-OmpF porin